MAEHDSDRDEREEREEREERGTQPAPEADRPRPAPPEGERARPGEAEGPADAAPGAAGPSFDEDAAWAAIVAGYGQEPPDPPGAKPFKSVEDLALLEADTNDEKPAPARPLGGSVAFAPGVGPRDHSLAEPSEDDFDEEDEGHFVPPEPPPLSEGDTTTKFAWLGVIGGPVLLLLAVVLDWEMTWWLTLLTIGGFLGGFATLVARMRPDDEGDDDPGRGAVV
ncbi:hypothetical protein VM636_22360 [Streptomyces sp. SCSIO 75703]|uniref:hypothetical protein n=1 Tax=unclassified Streptomyces TaxID=2593676 RepID=UPI0006B4E3C8|nr:hypothetical protein [Streptomyces sp. TP-A0875]